MRAGDEFTFYLDTAVYHVGPTSLYLSKAPGMVVDYDGSGAWFKFWDWGEFCFFFFFGGDVDLDLDLDLDLDWHVGAEDVGMGIMG